MKTYVKPMEIFTVYYAARSAAAKMFACFYCILRGAKRRGEKMTVLVHITRREAPRRKFWVFLLYLCILARGGASHN